MSRRSRVAAFATCLTITAAPFAAADTAQPQAAQAQPLEIPEQLTIDYVENPFAPHVTVGSELRLGTAVGYVYGEHQNVLALGAVLAAGHRFGRFALEVEGAYSNLDSTDDTNTRLGRSEHLGVVARYDILRVGSRYMGPNSMFAIYTEGGAAQTWMQWFDPGANDPARMVPDNSARVEGQIGLGIEIEHRLQEPVKIPRRVAWFLGWRMAFSPHQDETMSICRGSSCDRESMPTDGTTYVDRSLLFQSSMAITW